MPQWMWRLLSRQAEGAELREPISGATKGLPWLGSRSHEMPSLVVMCMFRSAARRSAVTLKQDRGRGQWPWIRTSWDRQLSSRMCWSIRSPMKGEGYGTRPVECVHCTESQIACVACLLSEVDACYPTQNTADPRAVKLGDRDTCKLSVGNHGWR